MRKKTKDFLAWLFGGLALLSFILLILSILKVI
jgi:hypothetical protein